ncbi:MAG TPA: hypothetical protein VFA89_06135 [Terriglobales bacterium]|nr:hypothetical protein [Terriglobales bacterium]
MMPTHFRLLHDRYFHPHPWHDVFALVASLVLAGLMVLVLATAAH